MLRTIEKETGKNLCFVREVISDRHSLNTVVLELKSSENERFMLVSAYDSLTEKALETLKEKAVWSGIIYKTRAALFCYDEKIFAFFNALPGVSVQEYKGKKRPAFSMCRFDEIYEKPECFYLCIKEEKKEYILPVRIKDDKATLGTWLSFVSRQGFLAAVDYIFKNRKVKSVEYTNLPYSPLLDNGWRHNDFFLPLPASAEELRKNMTQKSRYNLKREKRIIEEAFGELTLQNIAAKDVTDDIIETFYRFKNATHEIKQKDYDITKLPLTDYYLLKTADGVIRAIAVSCEQGDDVFIENHTFDCSKREYSFGKQLYETYIEAIINKGKTGLALAGGTLDYKNRYGTVCFTAYSGKITRAAYKSRNILRRFCKENKPLSLKKWSARLKRFIK